MSVDNSTEPLLTVVVPVYNRRDVVCRTLDTIAVQTARPLCLIVVDNASTDGTGRVLAEWKARNRNDALDVRILHETVPGAAAARQCGLMAVTTPWVLFFDSDDLMLPGHLENALLAIEANPEADIIGWPVSIDELGGTVRIGGFAMRDFWWETVFHGQFATVRWCARTQLVRRAGGWNPEVRFWDDIELGARMLALNPKIASAGDNPTAHVLAGEDSVTGPTCMSAFGKFELPLMLMERSMPAGTAVWLDFKRAHFAALCFRESRSAKVREYVHDLFRRPSRLKDRLIVRFIYHYTRFGGRGFAYLIKPFYKTR